MDSPEAPGPAAIPPPTAAAPAAWASPEPEPGPAPGLEFGGAGERLLAYIVDSLLISALVLVIGLVGLVLALVAWPLAIVVCLVGWLLVGLGYFPYFWVRTGQTPGLRIFGLRVVRDRDGGPVGPGAALLRLFGLYVIDGILYLGFIWIFIDQRKRCWHDLLAGTVVVKRIA